VYSSLALEYTLYEFLIDEVFMEKSNQVMEIVPGQEKPLSKLEKFLKSEAFSGYVCISPWLIGFLVFTLGPLLVSFGLMFFDYAGYQKITYVGLENITKTLVNDYRLKDALIVSLKFSASTVTLYLVIGLLLALLINQKFPGHSIFRSIYFLPAAVSGIAMVYVWLMVFEIDYGLLNQILVMFGFDRIKWLTSTEWALRSYIIMAVYGVGNYMIVYLGGLQGIPDHLYEAAEIDGAGPLGKLRHVTLPLLTPTIFFLMVISVIQSLQVFMQGYMLTQGGPIRSTLFYVLYLYQVSFQERRFGYGSVLAWILFLIILGLTALQFRLSRRWVHYEV
jgi:multiple sugar transport system permease protein